MTRRKEFSRRTKLLAFQSAEGRCQECGCKVGGSVRVEYDHRIPCEMGGDNSLLNCEVLCSPCHKAKTRADVGDMAKARSVEARHVNATTTRAPLPGGRKSKWKKRMDGTVVRRDA